MAKKIRCRKVCQRGRAKSKVALRLAAAIRKRNPNYSWADALRRGWAHVKSGGGKSGELVERVYRKKQKKRRAARTAKRAAKVTRRVARARRRRLKITAVGARAGGVGDLYGEQEY